MGNRLLEPDTVRAPLRPISEKHPLGTLVRPIVHGLTEVVLAQLHPNSLHLDKEAQLPTRFDRKIAEGATNDELSSNFAVLIISKHVGQDVRHDQYGVGFADIPSPRRLEELLIPA